MTAGVGLMLGAIALFLVNSIVAWHERWPVASATARAAALGSTLLLAGGLALLTALAAGRRSRTALWLLIAFAGLAVASTAYRGAIGRLPGGVVGVMTMFSAGLALTASALLLVGRGARRWFRTKEQS